MKTIKKVDEIFLEVYFIIFSFALLIEYVLSFASRRGSMFVYVGGRVGDIFKSYGFCGLYSISPLIVSSSWPTSR